MAWLEIHQSLPMHHKTIQCATLLEIPVPQVVGHLVSLWLWALDNTNDGTVKAIDRRLADATIARASQWAGDPDCFVDALVAVGFLDRDDDALKIHDWYEYAGKLLEQRKYVAQQKRRHRELYNNKALVQAIRDRDKDQCRYCGRLVNWQDRKGADGATYDYVDPEGPTSLENIVVACRACSAGKNQRTPEEAGYTLTPPAKYLQISSQNLVKIQPVSTHTVPNSTVQNSTKKKKDKTLVVESNDSTPGVPVKEIVKAFNETFKGTGIPQVRELTKVRRQHIKREWQKQRDGLSTLEDFKKFFAYLRDTCRIHTLRTVNGHQWFSLDWLFKFENNFAKALEGNYAPGRKVITDETDK